MKIAGSVLALALVAGLGACSHNNTQSAGAQSPQGQSQAQASAASCPMAQLPGVHATVADTSDGVAITFTGPQNEVDQLRQNVHAMSDANDKQGNAFAACPCAFGQSGSAEAMPGNESQSGQQGGQWNGNTSMQPASVQADAKVDEIPTGAVLELKAKDKSQVQTLRDDVRSEVHSMKENGCLTRK